MAPVLPELGSSFGVSAAAAASSLTVYLLPFAALMLVSGTLGERWGPARTVRVAYVVYAVSSLAAALAPWFWLFQCSRGLQGAANAFTMPLLMAKLSATTPPERLGRVLGLFGAMQALGQTSGPLAGGLAAEASWRWAFVGIAVVAAVLAACPLPPDTPPQGAPARLRDSWRRSIVLPGLVALVGWAALSGITFLVALRLQDAFGFGAGLRGVALTGFGIAGFLTARLVGAVCDRYGARWAAASGLLGGAVLVAATGLSGSAAVATATWSLAGVCAQLVIVGVNSSVLAGEERGRGGAISIVQAMRFLGMSAAPALFTAPYHHGAALGFLLPAALLVLVAPAALALRGGAYRTRRTGTAPRERLRHSRG